jgi:GDP-L-fucose synthase
MSDEVAQHKVADEVASASQTKEIILVTGGTGLVGKAIEKVTSNTQQYQYIFMSSKDADLCQWTDTIQYFERIQPTYVIHLAANVGGLFKNMTQKVDMLEKNVLINMNVLRAAHAVKVKKLIACLSTCIFPDKTSYPINETMLHNGAPHTSNDAYAYAKRLLESQCKAYQEQYGDDFICIIPTNIYGAYDNFHLEDAHVIPALIHKCYLAKRENKPFIVSGSGKPLRQFIYSEDLAKLIIWTLENYHEKDSIILSVGEDDEVSIGYVAKLIALYMGHMDTTVFDTTKPDGQYKKTADNNKLMKLLLREKNDFRFTSIEDGLSHTVKWFVDNYDVSRKG